MNARRAVAMGLGLTIVAVAGPAGAAAPSVAPRAKPYKTLLSCKPQGERSDRFCFDGDHPAAVLRAFGRARLDYDLCVRRPSGNRRCADKQTGRPGKRSRVRVELGGSGRYRVAWFTNGRAIDRDAIVVRNRSVFANGDSLGEGTRPYLPRALPGWRVSQSVSISRHAPEGVALLRRRDALPGVIVMSLGTNDDPRSLGAFRDAVRATISIAGRTRCVVWPNIVRPPVGGVSYAGYNRVLAAEARKRQNLRVVDWVELVARNRAWLASDGVHVNATGYRARARAIAEQVERC